MQLDEPDNRRKRVCHQTIYSWIHQQKRLLPSFSKSLRRRGKRYRYGRANVRQMFPERRQIEDRPEIVAARSRLGDWEGDTIHGHGRSGYVATYVDRRSGFLIAGKLKKFGARTLTERTQDLFRKIPKRLRRTLTVDNGPEFCDHLRLEKLTDLQVCRSGLHVPVVPVTAEQTRTRTVFFVTTFRRGPTSARSLTNNWRRSSTRSTTDHESDLAIELQAKFSTSKQHQLCCA